MLKNPFNVNEKNAMKNPDRRGEGILSLLLGLAVVGVVLVSIYTTYRAGQDDSRIRRAENQFAIIQKSMSDAFAASGTVTNGALNSALISANKAPQDAVSGGALMHPWGGAITVTGSGGSTYTVSFSALPASACSTMAARPNGSLQQSVQVGSNGVATSLDFGTASTQCAGGQTVTWTLTP